MLVTTGERKSIQKHFIFKKYEESLKKSFRQIRENFGIGS